MFSGASSPTESGTSPSGMPSCLRNSLPTLTPAKNLAPFKEFKCQIDSAPERLRYVTLS